MGLLDDFTEEELAEEEEEEVQVEEKKTQEGIFLKCDPNKKSVTTEEEVKYKVKIVNSTSSDQTIELSGHVLYSFTDDEVIPWNVKVPGGHTLSETSDEFKEDFKVDKGDEQIVTITVQAPEGARYGDKVEVVLDATSKKDIMLSDSITLITTSRPTVVAVKTQIGQEKNVADYIANWAKKGNKGVFAVLAPKPVRGYIFLEAMNPHRVEEAIKSTRRAKGVVDGDTSIEEVEHFLAPKLAVEGIAEGDIVELSAGPFKGEKARVTQINEDNDEITVELFEATVPIPVTVRGDHVRVLEKED